MIVEQAAAERLVRGCAHVDRVVDRTVPVHEVARRGRAPRLELLEEIDAEEHAAAEQRRTDRHHDHHGAHECPEMPPPVRLVAPVGRRAEDRVTCGGFVGRSGPVRHRNRAVRRRRCWHRRRDHAGVCRPMESWRGEIPTHWVATIAREARQTAPWAVACRGHERRAMSATDIAGTASSGLAERGDVPAHKGRARRPRDRRRHRSARIRHASRRRLDDLAGLQRGRSPEQEVDRDPRGDGRVGVQLRDYRRRRRLHRRLRRARRDQIDDIRAHPFRRTAVRVRRARPARPRHAAASPSGPTST